MPEPAPSKAPMELSAPSALTRFLADARAIEDEIITPFRDDPRVVQHNVGVGVSAVLAWEAHVREHLPHVDLAEIRSLPDLALCLAHAADAASGGGIEAAEARELTAEAHALRRVLKAAAASLAQSGLLAPKDIAKIGGDHGSIDAGGDCLALAALFERRAADLEGKTSITPQEIARAAEIGAKLRALTKPKAAARKPGPSGASAVDTRDRLWSLLLARHERLWAIGAYVYGHRVDEHVPPLTASPSKAKKPAKTKES